ncbi:unnamed protein product [Scytosiphon promiscuus]
MRVLRGQLGLTAMAALLLAAVIALVVPGAGAMSCSVIDSCDACRNTTLCHWCPDQQCHVIGSLHGCGYGTYCYDNNQCQRELPEFRGYEAPSLAVLLGVFLVGSTALFCGIAGISIAREYAKESAASRQQNAAIAAAAAGAAAAGAAATRTTVRPVRLRAAEPSGSGGDGGGVDDYVALNGGDGDDDGESGGLLGVGAAAARVSDGPSGGRGEERGAAAAAAAAETSTTPLVPKGKRDYGMGRVSRIGGGSSRRRGRAVASEPPPLGPSRLARKVYFYTRLVCGTIILGVLATCGAVVAFAPHAPGVNVCNTEFDWGSIVHSIKSADVQADFQILVSIYNPNVLDATIETGTATLYHKHTEVGTMAFQPAVLAGGYVTDLLFTMTFNTEVWDEARLGLEYETGQLAFLMDATVSAAVMWHGLKTYPFTFSIHDYYIKVADTTGYDRSLCNCTQMMQGKQPQRRQQQQQQQQQHRLDWAWCRRR